jgi:hypothetical protein
VGDEVVVVEVLDYLAECLAHVGVHFFFVLVDGVRSSGLVLRRGNIDVVRGLQIDPRDRALVVRFLVEPRALGRDPHQPFGWHGGIAPPTIHVCHVLVIDLA